MQPFSHTISDNEHFPAIRKHNRDVLIQTDQSFDTAEAATAYAQAVIDTIGKAAENILANLNFNIQ